MVAAPLMSLMSPLNGPPKGPLIGPHANSINRASRILTKDAAVTEMKPYKMLIEP